MITVFTPSYNRRKELDLLYQSLLRQDTDDFEWLIVDDGSSDKTDEYVKKLISDNKIKINYVYKENGGKQSAYNLGLEKCRGEIFLCIDSDDMLKDNILGTIIKDFENIKDDKSLAGIMYMQGYISDKEKIIGTIFPNDNMVDNYYNVYHKWHVTGDKLIVLKSNIAKEYAFPLIKGEKFVPEALVFNRIALKYNVLCKNMVAAYKEYLMGGYSNNYFDLVKRNPLGNALYFKEVYKFNKSFYNVYGYILFSIYGKKKFRDMIKEHPAKVKIILLYIPTLLVSLIRR